MAINVFNQRGIRLISKRLRSCNSRGDLGAALMPRPCRQCQESRPFYLGPRLSLDVFLIRNDKKREDWYRWTISSSSSRVAILRFKSSLSRNISSRQSLHQRPTHSISTLHPVFTAIVHPVNLGGGDKSYLVYHNSSRVSPLLISFVA